MTVLSELTIHIHSAPGGVCSACGDADDNTRAFITDVGAWNRTNDKCSPGTMLRPDYSISGRADPDTSALLDERFPNPKKTDDRR